MVEKNEGIDLIVMRRSSRMSFSTARDIISLLSGMSREGHETLLEIVKDVVELERTPDPIDDGESTDRMKAIADKYSK